MSGPGEGGVGARKKNSCHLFAAGLLHARHQANGIPHVFSFNSPTDSDVYFYFPFYRCGDLKT